MLYVPPSVRTMSGRGLMLMGAAMWCGLNLDDASPPDLGHSPVPIFKSYKAIGKRSKDIVASEKPAKVVSADENQAVKEKFVEGTAIEVKSDEDGFQGAWFAADILEMLSKDKFLIEYKNLKTDDDKEFCREKVDGFSTIEEALEGTVERHSG